MKVTQVAIRPTEASEKAGRPALTPELLAATGARYSRSNEGLEAILSKIDPENLDASVDGIFKMIDYGHQSIADMVPVAMFMDGISMWLAYYVWTQVKIGGGQESSTRYIKLSLDGVLSPDELGIPTNFHEEWYAFNQHSFECYERAVAFWTDLGERQPSLMNLPALLADTSEKAAKQIARMRRNYVFDRSRYWLPLGLATNVMVVQPAREWADLISTLLSHLLPEARELGGRLREELRLAAPRLVRHAVAKEEMTVRLTAGFEKLVAAAGASIPCDGGHSYLGEAEPKPKLKVMLPWVTSFDDANGALEQRENRYSPVGDHLRLMPIHYGWSAVAMAEIRDMNRHRTGEKHCPLLPGGFYGALDQLPVDVDGHDSLGYIQNLGGLFSGMARDLLAAGHPWYVYLTLLGTQYPFYHTTTVNKWVYTVELRTGTGAHFRYARHYRDVAELWFKKFPTTRGLIKLGQAEPE